MLGLGLAAAIVVAPGDARAQTTTASSVSPTGKGTVGGALLGGEVVCLTMGAVGVEKGWPYWVFGGVGAVGGGIGGYVVDSQEKSSGTAEPSLYMLAGGMVLLIPTLIVSLNATAFHPPDAEVKEPVNNEPANAPPRPGAKAKAKTRTADAAHVPVSLVDVSRGQLAMGVPAVQLKPLYSQKEVWQFGVAQGTEVTFPVLRAVF
jgi:hypothetical protein